MPLNILLQRFPNLKIYRFIGRANSNRFDVVLSRRSQPSQGNSDQSNLAQRTFVGHRVFPADQMDTANEPGSLIGSLATLEENKMRMLAALVSTPLSEMHITDRTRFPVPKTSSQNGICSERALADGYFKKAAMGLTSSLNVSTVCETLRIPSAEDNGNNQRYRNDILRPSTSKQVCTKYSKGSYQKIEKCYLSSSPGELHRDGCRG